MNRTASRDILAANLRRMIECDGVSLRAWSMGKCLDVRMIDRLVKSEHAATLDKIDEIAAACGLSAWQLLSEDLDPKRPPSPMITTEERAVVAELRRNFSK